MKQRRANGQGSLIKLNGCRFWYAQYYDQMGRKIRVSTKTDVKQEAQNKLTEMIADAQRGLAPIADANKLTYSDLRAGLLASYVEKGNKSLKQRANGEETVNGLAQLDGFFGFGPDNRGPRVIRINTETGRAFVKARQAEGAGNAVINRSLALTSYVAAGIRGKEDSIRASDSLSEGTTRTARLPGVAEVRGAAGPVPADSEALHHVPVFLWRAARGS